VLPVLPSDELSGPGCGGGSAHHAMLARSHGHGSPCCWLEQDVSQARGWFAPPVAWLEGHNTLARARPSDLSSGGKVEQA